tara:strand:+ start:331 stop:552 length:222 start_codon:yes stop_codon:yes gene_type:complete
MSDLDDIFESLDRFRLFRDEDRDEEMKFFKYKKQRNKLYTVNAYNKNKQLIWGGYNVSEKQLEEYKEKYQILK